MLIRCGYTLALDTFGPTPMVLLLNVRPERQPDLRSRETIAFDPPVQARRFRDPFGNVATRIHVPGGRITMSADFEIEDHGCPDAHAPEARQVPVEDLPDEVLPFLLGSRYCDTDKLSQTAWNLFGTAPEGWARVQAIVDYAHGRLRFDYMQADATRSAFDGHGQQVGVCRDFAHLAITLCRCMNIPAATPPGTWVTSACRRTRRRWISRRGSRSTWTDRPDPAGTPSTPGTTGRASAASSWRTGVTRPTAPSRPASGRHPWQGSRCTPMRSADPRAAGVPRGL
jgi:transglutaminase-like putative cysteine protease